MSTEPETWETDVSMIRKAFWIFGLEFAFATAFLAQRMHTNAVLLRKFLLDDCELPNNENL